MKNSDRISKGTPNNGGSNQMFNRLAPVNNSKMKNRNRMGGGGGGLSLQAFANAKTKTDGYNPALIKKQREFYKNAKYVSKFKKSQKQQNQEEGSSQATKSIVDGSENREVGERYHQGKKKNGNKAAYSLKEIYEKKRGEEEKARMEKEAIIEAKRRKKEESEGRRKAQREKMLKRTKSGQPIMKYRIEHLLQTIQGSKR